MDVIEDFTLCVKTVNEHESKLTHFEHGTVLLVKEGSHMCITLENNGETDADVILYFGDQAVKHVRVEAGTRSIQRYDHTKETKLTATRFVHLSDTINKDLKTCLQHSYVKARFVPALAGSAWDSSSSSSQDDEHVVSSIPEHCRDRSRIRWLSVQVALTDHEFAAPR